MNHVLAILDYIVESFIHIWPYLLVTIPIAVAVQMSGASSYIRKVFMARPMAAILLSTLVGAFSPLCSCSVIPVVAAMLISGVPLAPVMSFWLASPSMDPEIFFLTVGSLGWDLAVWRLGATLGLSLGGGFVTHFLVERGWLGAELLRTQQSTKIRRLPKLVGDGWRALRRRLAPQGVQLSLAVEGAACGCEPVAAPITSMVVSGAGVGILNAPVVSGPTCSVDGGCGGGAEVSEDAEEGQADFLPRLLSETWTATTMVIKFMLIAWFIGALIRLYVPEVWITNALGGDNPFAIPTAALLGIPVYTSNLAAMPLVGGLLAQGMSPAAALAFLIAGPMTTLPAMSAVWGLVNRRVFALYIGFALGGALVLGYVYGFVM